MSEESLRELLARVHQHLSAGAPLEGEARAQLGRLMRDIERTLGEGSEAAPVATPRLEQLAVKFEASHPALAETLREVIDALAKAGI
jgi:hypothetical protein